MPSFNDLFSDKILPKLVDIGLGAITVIVDKLISHCFIQPNKSILNKNSVGQQSISHTSYNNISNDYYYYNNGDTISKNGKPIVYITLRKP